MHARAWVERERQHAHTHARAHRHARTHACACERTRDNRCSAELRRAARAVSGRGARPDGENDVRRRRIQRRRLDPASGGEKCKLSSRRSLRLASLAAVPPLHLLRLEIRSDPSMEPEWSPQYTQQTGGLTAGRISMVHACEACVRARSHAIAALPGAAGVVRVVCDAYARPTSLRRERARLRRLRDAQRCAVPSAVRARTRINVCMECARPHKRARVSGYE